MINLCSDGHNEICYEGLPGACPVCIILDKHQEDKADLEDEVSRLEAKLKELQDIIKNDGEKSNANT